MADSSLSEGREIVVLTWDPTDDKLPQGAKAQKWGCLKRRIFPRSEAYTANEYLDNEVANGRAKVAFFVVKGRTYEGEL